MEPKEGRSKRARHRIAAAQVVRRGLLVVCLASLACTQKPVHFPEAGTAWELPMVEPERSPIPLVSVRIHQRGPYVFALDPDAPTVIDRAVADELGLFSRADSWRQVRRADDTLVPARPYEILRLSSGKLTLRNFEALGVEPGSLDTGERRIHGVLGGDLLTRTIVVDIDRRAGFVTLHSAEHFQPPAGAILVRGRALRNPSFAERGLAVPTRVEGLGEVELVVSLSAPSTALRSGAFARLPAPAMPTEQVWLDPFGSQRISRAAKPTTLALTPAVRQTLQVQQLPDDTLWSYDFAGVLGQDVLSRYRSIYDRDRRHLWLVDGGT